MGTTNLLDAIVLKLALQSNYLSGEDLAKEYMVSRVTISQKVMELRRLGWEIESVTNRGYRLVQSKDILSGPLIQHGLGLLGIPCEVLHFSTIGSTNTWASENMDGLGPLSLVVADEQTAGRGRFERSFYSPRTSGLYMSLVLKQAMDASHGALMTCAAAVGTRRAVKRCFGVDLGIKWVNDLYNKGKKVAGILTEGRLNLETGSLHSMVIGIGINLSTVEFPEAVTSKAGAILEPSPGQQCSDTNSGLHPAQLRNNLTIAVVHEFLKILKELPGTSFMDEYRDASLVLDREVEVHHHAEVLRGVATAIDDQGHLVVRDFHGRSHTCHAGEVSLKDFVP